MEKYLWRLTIFTERRITLKKHSIRFLSLILSILMMTLLLAPSVASADVLYDLKVCNDKYFTGTNSLKSLDAEFLWGGADATSRLVLATKELKSSELTDLGSYGKSFISFENALAHDQAYNTFGIINYSNETKLRFYKEHTITFNFKETDIPLSVNKDYYVYLWSYYSGHYYPDYIITTIRVKDGNVSYTNDEGDFVQIGTPDAPSPDAPTPDVDNVEPTAKPDIPKTDDEFNFALWALLAVVSAAGLVMLRRYASSSL